jgi:hypothetical protein
MGHGSDRVTCRTHA